MNPIKLSALTLILACPLTAQQTAAPAPVVAPQPVQAAPPPQLNSSPNRTAIPIDAAASTPRPGVDPVAPPLNAPAITPRAGQTEAEAIQAAPGAVSATPQAVQSGSPVSGAPQPTFQQRRVVMTELPPTVRQAITSQTGTQPTQIQLNNSTGSPVYEVTTMRNGQPVTFQVNANGTLVTPGAPVVAPVGDSSAASTLPVPNQTGTITGDGRTRTVAFAQLPPAVQRAITSQLGSAPTGVINTSTLNGVPVFEVPVVRDGVASTLWFAQDGSQIPPAAIAAGNPAGQTVIATNSFYSSMPPVVARNVSVELKTAEIQSVDKKKMDVYTARFEKDGKQTELRILEDGTPVGPRPNGTGGNSSFAEPLVSEKTISFDETPLPVQSALKDRTGLALIESILVGQAFNRTVYQASFKKENKQTEIRLGSDGTMIGMREKAMATTEGPSTTVRFLDAPAKVRAAFNHQAPAVGIDSLEKSSMEIFLISFRRDGKTSDLQVASDGTIIRSESSGNLASIPVGDLPEPVQKALRDYSASAAISTVQRSTANGQVIYRATWDQNGRARDVAFTEAGTVFTEPSGATLSTTKPLVETSAAITTYNDLPEVVRASVKDQVTADNVTQITRSRVDGKTVYHISTGRDAASRTVVVAEDGQVIR